MRNRDWQKSFSRDWFSPWLFYTLAFSCQFCVFNSIHSQPQQAHHREKTTLHVNFSKIPIVSLHRDSICCLHLCLFLLTMCYVTENKAVKNHRMLGRDLKDNLVPPNTHPPGQKLLSVEVLFTNTHNLMFRTWNVSHLLLTAGILDDLGKKFHQQTNDFSEAWHEIQALISSPCSLADMHRLETPPRRSFPGKAIEVLVCVRFLLLLLFRICWVFSLI